MKRSEINGLMRDAVRFCGEMKFHLPPFVYWTPDEWREKDAQYDEIRDNLLGWDITDFGSGTFDKEGLLLVTIRNGNAAMSDKYKKPYAEKVMIVQENQVTPYHYHASKQEDIINRGGGNLIIKFYARTEDDRLSDGPVMLHVDGRAYTAQAGEEVRLAPGESVSINQGVYHSFWAEAGKGAVLAGEVSMVNDDSADNHFLDGAGRFPEIDEDESPLYLLAMDYNNYK